MDAKPKLTVNITLFNSDTEDAKWGVVFVGHQDGQTQPVFGCTSFKYFLEVWEELATSVQSVLRGIRMVEGMLDAGEPDEVIFSQLMRTTAEGGLAGVDWVPPGWEVSDGK